MNFHLFPLLLLLSLTKADSSSSQYWSGYGANYHNNRFASSNTQITTTSIPSLSPHCQLPFPLGVSATPVTYQNTVYFPTWNGSLVALNYQTCLPVWTLNLTSLILSYGPISPLQTNTVTSRTSPQIDGDVLYFGTLAHALIVAVNRNTGAVLGSISINSHPLAIITTSPTFYNNKLFVGAASGEETAADSPGYVCCSFIGNVVALSFDKNAGKFEVLWDIPLIPASKAAQGWSGSAVWGSQPSIDVSRNQVFFATGNTYTLPPSIIECQNLTSTIPAVIQGLVPDPCLPRDILQETILAVDIDLGILNWDHQLPALDAWTLACGVPGLVSQNYTLCPHVAGPDADFGMAPTFVAGSKRTPYGKDTLVVGQKNGILHAMSAEAGQSFWSTATSPGGTEGGLSWGIAVDDSQVYFTAINSLGLEWQLQPGNVSTSGSGYGAVSLSTGDIVWEIAAPQPAAYSPPTVVGDLVLVLNTGDTIYAQTNGSLLALEKTTGKIASRTTLFGAPHGGVAVQGSNILFGTGYGGVGDLPGTTPLGDFYVLRVGS